LIGSNGYLSPAGIHVLAHRGLASPGTPENTLAAFEAALAAGVTHIESDIQATSDGVAVLFHDSDLKRVAGIPRRVIDLTLKQIKDIRIAGHTIPTLEEALLAFPSARFNLDIKNAAAIEPTVEVIANLEASQRVLVSSFSNQRRSLALQALSDCGLKVATSADGKVIAKLLWSVFRGDFKDFQSTCSTLDALQIPTNYFGISLTGKRLLKFAQQAGIPIQYWVVNDPSRMLELVALGASGIVTDRADLAVKTLRPGR